MRRRPRVRPYSEPPEVLSLPGWVIAAVELGGAAIGAAAGTAWGLQGAVVGALAGGLPGAVLQWRLGADQERMIAYLRRRVERPSTMELQEDMARRLTIENAAGRRWDR